MDSRDLEQIESFLGMVGKASLFAYYDLGHDAPDAAVEATLKKRRAWAQGQQANPKYRAEALWLIKNNALLRRTLLQNRRDYVGHVANAQARQSLQKLEPFMRGTLAGGVLTSEAEQAILRQGQQLGLQESQVREALGRLVQEVGARRKGQPAPERPKAAPKAAKKPASPFKDYYGILGVPPDADRASLEAAHKQKYRSARNRRDKQAVSALYADLDEAWRVLTDPVRKASYDAQWRAAQAGIRSPDVSSDVVEISGFLPPPVKPKSETPSKPPQRATPPAQAPRATPPPLATPTPMQAPVPTEEAPPRRGPPPKPEGIGGRTLGLGSSRRPRRATPRLAVASPEVISLTLSRKPESFSVVVKNIGDGRMAGRITVDKDWLELSRSRLDPDAEQQEIDLTINPSDLASRRETGLLTIVTEHGERKTITINAERKGISPAIVLGGVVGLLGAVGVSAMLLMGGGGAETDLVIMVEPMADVVEINGQRVGDGALVELTEGFPIGEPFVLSTRLQGFSSDERQVVAEEGERNELRVTLNPEPKSRPAAEPDAEVNVEALDKAIARRAASLGDCLPAGAAVTATGDIALGPTGELLFLKLDPASLPNSEAAACVERQLHLVDYPGHGGTLALIEGHSIPITPGAG